MLLENERIVPIGNGISAIISDEYNFSSDTILLADFANPGNKDKVIELGTGCGALVLFWAALKKTQAITAVDIQKTACNMLKRSVELNCLEDKIKVINKDITKPIVGAEKGCYDLVAVNPPYKASGTGKISCENSRLFARHETLCIMDDVAKAAFALLKYGGRLCLCQRVDRLCDTFDAMRKYNIEPKKLRFVHKDEKSQSKLFLVQGKKGSHRGLTVMPPLFMYDVFGNKTPEIKRIYKFCEE